MKANNNIDLKLTVCWVYTCLQYNVYVPTLTDQNSIQEEIKSILKLGNACYYSVQHLLSSRLLFKNLKIKMYIEL